MRGGWAKQDDSLCMEAPVKRFLTIEEKALELGVTRETLRRWRKEGIGPKFVCYGETVRYYPEAEAGEDAA